MKIIPYGVANTAANAQLDPEYAKNMPSAAENLSRQIPLHPEFYSEDSGKGGTWLDYSFRIWNQWFAGN